jgi:hypothetical protein
MEEKNLETWAEFEAAVEHIRAEHERSDAMDKSPLLFRDKRIRVGRLRQRLIEDKNECSSATTIASSQEFDRRLKA